MLLPVWRIKIYNRNMAPTTLFSLRYLMEKNFSVAYFQQHISPFISNIIVAIFCCILLVLCVLFLNYYFFRVYELFIGKCCVCVSVNCIISLWKYQCVIGNFWNIRFQKKHTHFKITYECMISWILKTATGLPLYFPPRAFWNSAIRSSVCPMAQLPRL